MRLLIFVLLGFTYCSVWGQITITGSVKNIITKDKIAFANIGIRHKNIGSVANSIGIFSLTLEQKYQNDTLIFSCVGYEELSLPIKQIISLQQSDFQLTPKLLQLDTVSAIAPRLKEKKIGVYKYNPLLHFTDGSIGQDDIFEIAQLMHLGNKTVKLTSLNLHINEPRKDSGIFRINFYAFDGKMPGKRIIEKEILQTKSIRPGWLSFDLANDNIRLKGDIIVSVEFLPSGKKEYPIVYEIKLGGRSKSFVRTHSIGIWTVPPHHYRMYITALVPSNSKETVEQASEEKEAIATARLYSNYVKDSFSIFVSLPKGYTKINHAQYPVIYLLDANAYFDAVSGHIENLCKSSLYRKSVLIGIGYKNAFQMDSLRSRDYTYPLALVSDSLNISGGADKFYNFIKQELIPYIDTTYNTQKNDRTLMGHSLGGYFTLFALQQDITNTSTTFSNYIAASPSLDYRNQYIISQFQQLAERVMPAPSIVYITMGELEDAEDGMVTTQTADAFNKFTQQFSNNYHNIKLSTKVLPSATHMQTAVATFEDAIEQIMKNK